MKYKLIKLSLLALIFFCHGHYNDQYVVSGSWLSSQVKNRPARLPAQVNLELNSTPECKVDLFTAEELKREASFYESQLESNTKLSGKWKHLDLEDLPLAQARFFKAIGNNFGDLSNPSGLDVSMCGDPACVVNKVYNSATGIEGWAIYVWWLKMGNIISFKNIIYKNEFFDKNPNIPGQYNGGTYDLQDYLFTKDELYAFWKMSNYLPTQYKILTNLNEIQRIPKSATIEGYPPPTCGLAWSSGYILLQDGCLSFEHNSNNERGGIYHLVHHELNHIVDNFRSGQPEKFRYSSEDEPWLNEGKWTTEEYLNTTSGAMEKRWKTGLTAKDFVTGYASISPIEHFAESLAFFRYNGEHTKSKLPVSTYDFIKSSIYNQVEYTDDGMQVYLRQQIERNLIPLVFQATMDCYQNEHLESLGKSIGITELPSALSLGKRQCLYEKRQTLIEQSLAEVKLNTADGCSYLRLNERQVNFKNLMKEWISSQFNSHIQKALEDEKYFEQLGKFYQELANGIIPIQLMTDCYKEGDESACYSQKIKNFIDQIITDGSIDTERLSADLENKFLETYGFELVRNEMVKSYQDFISTQSLLITESALELWERCASGEISNALSPIAGPFSVRMGWLVSSQYNCLNQNVTKRLEDTVSQMNFNGDEISSDKEKQILKDFSLVNYLNELQRLMTQAKLVEYEELVETVGTVESLRDYLLSDFSWVKAFESDVRRMCLVKAVSLLPIDLRYHSRSELETLTRPACEQVRKSPELRNYEKDHPELKEEHHVQSYLNEVMRFSKERASVCEAKYPTKGFFSKLRNRGRRSDCFTEGWEIKNTELISKALDTYGLRLSASSLERMNTEGQKIRKRIKSDLMGEIIPDIGL